MPSDTSPAELYPAANLLAHAKSPYLRQHADNPVHWREWGKDALAEARHTGKPILLSIGYAACHWCHVMAHESFEDPDTAALMNQLFVNIKIDREERPDIDHIFMGALQALGEQGGWPLTMFLDRNANPFWGGTYFPPHPSHGRPSFRQILLTISDAHAKQDAAVAGNAKALAQALSDLNAAIPGPAIGPEIPQQVAQAFMRMEDPVHGGLRGAPKFPNPPIFRFLWQFGVHTGTDDALAMVHRLLAALCAGGIHDHLGGGFARYSVDAEWLAPHFEKMLYDNAQILELLSLAHSHAPNPRYHLAATGIVDWLTGNMPEHGAFAASEDADSEGEEGKFYVWNKAEIEALLPQADAALFARAYDVTTHGNWEGKTILRRITPDGTAEAEAHLAQSRQILRQHRAQRIRPGRDGKVLADWNALTILALARASAAFAMPAWCDLAESTYAALQTLLRQPDGRLAHAWCDGRITAAGMLDDQAFGARAALALFEATGKESYLHDALTLSQVALTHFADASSGSFYTTAADAADVPLLRPRTAADNATPNGNGILADVFARLYHITGDASWHGHATALLAAFGGAGNRLAGMSSLVMASATLEHAATAVLCGNPTHSATQALATAVRAHPDPTMILLRHTADLPASHPAFGKTLPPGEDAALYICRHQTCAPPITRPAQLR